MLAQNLRTTRHRELGPELDPGMTRPDISFCVALAAALWFAIPGAGRAERVFLETAAETGLEFTHFNGMSGERYFAEIAGSGAALFDYDNDGDLDVYFAQGSMLGAKSLEEALFPPAAEPRDRLFRNDLRPDGESGSTMRFVDVTEASDIEAPGYGIGVAAGDIDNDGWTDLYVTNLGPNQMLRNNGNGTFSDVTASTGTGDRRWGISAAFLDYDGDGWLDLYVANYVEFRVALDKQCVSPTGSRDYCGPLAYTAEPDRLYRNRGDGTFDDVTTKLGIDRELRSGLGVVTGDFNSDGWVDIYVANDQMPNILWMNQKDGTLVNDALLAGCAVNETGLPEASMGVVVGDLNGDGYEDIFMSHLSRETNTIYLNDGTGFFTDGSRTSGLGMPSFKYTGFGIAILDYDLNGAQDLYVADGAVNLIEELARTGDPYPLEQPDQLFRNSGGGRFEDVTARAGEVFERREVGRGVSVGDLDLDGDPDLIVANNTGPAWLLENSIGAGEGSWLSARLLERPAGRDQLGTKLTLAAGDERWFRRIATDGSYASANSVWADFGLGAEPGMGSVDLRADWIGGGVSEWLGVPARRRWLFYRPRS
ncbi:MAG: CRTAC1 family protein [Thermoanaerobaculia bacterium]